METKTKTEIDNITSLLVNRSIEDAIKSLQNVLTNKLNADTVHINLYQNGNKIELHHTYLDLN